MSENNATLTTAEHESLVEIAVRQAAQQGWDQGYTAGWNAAADELSRQALAMIGENDVTPPGGEATSP